MKTNANISGNIFYKKNITEKYFRKKIKITYLKYFPMQYKCWEYGANVMSRIVIPNAWTMSDINTSEVVTFDA